MVPEMGAGAEKGRKANVAYRLGGLPTVPAPGRLHARKAIPGMQLASERGGVLPACVAVEGLPLPLFRLATDLW